jgi:hypothetical protein
MANEAKTDVIAMTESWFAKAPALPENIRLVLVRFAPILALIFGVLSIITGISGFGILTAFLPLAVMGGASGYGSGYIAAFFLVVTGVLMLAAYPGLKARKINGWNLLFWSEVINLVYNLVALNILGAIVGGLISFYLLFQVKSYYK